MFTVGNGLTSYLPLPVMNRPSRRLSDGGGSDGVRADRVVGGLALRDRDAELCRTGVVATANSVDVMTDTATFCVEASGNSDSERRFDAGEASESMRLCTCAGGEAGRTRNMGTVKKTVDATAAAEIRTRSHF